MTTRAASKQGRPTAKSSVKTLGKDQTRGEKQLTNVLEIVPGKFNETDWLSLLENDDTEDFIADIFENIWTDTSKQIQQIYIRKQLLSFTLMMTENALSNVIQVNNIKKRFFFRISFFIQWAFLERDEPKPASGHFWAEDSGLYKTQWLIFWTNLFLLEPVPCTMDNWGEGVVPACREERPQRLFYTLDLIFILTNNVLLFSVEESPISVVERPSTAPLSIPSPDNIDRIERPSTGSSVASSIHTSRSSNQSKKLSKIIESDHVRQHIQREQSIKTTSDDRTSIQKDSSTEQNTNQSSFEQKPYYHDILVIHTQPPKVNNSNQCKNSFSYRLFFI